MKCFYSTIVLTSIYVTLKIISNALFLSQVICGGRKFHMSIRNIIKNRFVFYGFILLIICGTVLPSIQFLRKDVVAAPIKGGSVKVISVSTTDGNQNRKNLFARGDLIEYNVDVYSTISSSPSIDIRFEVVATNYNKFVASYLYNYDTTVHIDEIPLGSSSFHTSAKIPSHAAPATYAIRITATPSGRAFSASSGWNSFTVQPPSQLGPFETGTISLDGGSVQGTAQLALFQNGGYNFNGCLHNSNPNIFPYEDSFVWGVASASGVVYQFPHSGQSSGTWAFWSSQDDCWNTTGTSSAIAGDWIALTEEVDHWDANVNIDIGLIIQDVFQALATIVPIIRTVVEEIILE